MASLPIEKKAEIQRAFLRHRELVKELPGVDHKVMLGNIVRWGGLAVVVVGIIRLTIGRHPFTSEVMIFAAIVCIVGWIYHSGVSKKQAKLWEEKMQIFQSMDAIGVHFSDDRDRTTVYAGSGSDSGVVFPLKDDNYA